MSDEERLSEVDDLFGEDNNASESEGESEALKSINISLPRHAIAQHPEEDTYTLKLPVFLNVEAHSFDPSEFKEKVQQSASARLQTDLNEKQVHNELVAEKLMNENTIRWRYSNSGNDEIIKQSNAHFVQWDDGSVSLKIGGELFDFKELPLFDTFLVKAHDSYEILQNDSIITKSVNLLPASTHTSTHRKLTQAVKNIQKKDKILNTITDNDPLMKQRLADENERKSLKLKRQLESKRRLQEERLERGAPTSFREREPAYERFARTYGEEEYDEEDDFVAGDDEIEEYDEDEGEEQEEEDERGAERLRKLKEDGAQKYREEEEVKRKRRRIIDSDEEDEE